MNHRLLAVDDDSLVLELVQATFSGRFDVRTAEDGAEARRLMESHEPHVVLLDIHLPDADGRELLAEARALPKPPIVIMMTADSSVEGAVEAMHNGAFHYLTKPFDIDSLDSLVSRAAEMVSLQKENRRLRRQADSRWATDGIIGKSPAMQGIFDTIEMVADTPTTVLIQGETGTGKELIARAIHHAAGAENAPFIKVNCAAIPSNLLESELFGHEKGAFTGADRRVAGKFEMANGGTILLDEISEIDPALQAKLLRVLQEREFYRLGGSDIVQTRCRVIATTNRNLRKEVDDGRFREDLFYRLNVVPLRVPPLRERITDIPLLIDHFLERYNTMTGKVVEFTEDVVAYLAELEWRGNIRELENCVERAVVMSRNNIISLSNILIPEEEDGSDELPFQVGMTVREAEQVLILGTLEHTEWNRTRAAEMLGISVRTLRNKLHEYREADELCEQVPPPGASRPTR